MKTCAFCGCRDASAVDADGWPLCCSCAAPVSEPAATETIWEMVNRNGGVAPAVARLMLRFPEGLTVADMCDALELSPDDDLRRNAVSVAARRYAAEGRFTVVTTLMGRVYAVNPTFSAPVKKKPALRPGNVPARYLEIQHSASNRPAAIRDGRVFNALNQRLERCRCGVCLTQFWARADRMVNGRSRFCSPGCRYRSQVRVSPAATTVQRAA